MAFSCCGLVCEIGISLTTYYRRRTLDCGSQTLRSSRTGHVFGEQVVEALHLGVRDQRDGAARVRPASRRIPPCPRRHPPAVLLQRPALTACPARPPPGARTPPAPDTGPQRSPPPTGSGP